MGTSSAGGNTERWRKVTDIKRTRLLKKYNIETKENLDQLIEELKQKVSAKTQRSSRYKKRNSVLPKLAF
jgi:hypothetical protein